MSTLCDLERELPGELAALQAAPGAGNRLLVRAGPVRLSFAPAGEEPLILFVAAGNRSLPAEQRLGAAAHLLLLGAGFELEDDYQRLVPAGSEPERVAIARQAAALLGEAYGCAASTPIEICLETGQQRVQHPSNPALVSAMEAARQAPSEAASRALWAALCGSLLLVPLDESGAPLTLDIAGDDWAALAFTDHPALLAGKSDCDYEPMPGPMLFEAALAQGAAGVWVSSGDGPPLELTRAQLEALLAVLARA